MNLLKHPELLDRLASSYALGTLQGGARRRFETLAREHRTVRELALTWQSRMASLTELQPQVVPSAAVWIRIDNLVRAELQAKALQSLRPNGPGASAAADKLSVSRGAWDWLRSLPFWRGVAAAGALASVVAVTASLNLREQMGIELAQLQVRLRAAPQIDYVAVLADEKSAASMLVTFDVKNKRLSLQRLGSYQEPSDRSLQLWALPAQGAPKSLGVLMPGGLSQPAGGGNDLRDVPTLAISLEPKGGVPGSGGPTGPVLFKGALIQKTL